MLRCASLIKGARRGTQLTVVRSNIADALVVVLQDKCTLVQLSKISLLDKVVETSSLQKLHQHSDSDKCLLL